MHSAPIPRQRVLCGVSGKGLYCIVLAGRIFRALGGIFQVDFCFPVTDAEKRVEIPWFLEGITEGCTEPTAPRAFSTRSTLNQKS